MNDDELDKPKCYLLGSCFPGIAFTEREVCIVIGLLTGKTLDEIAEVLYCSIRTVLFYIESMKKTLSCNSIDALIKCIKRCR